MSVDYRLTAPAGERIPLEAIWQLLQEMYPAEVSREAQTF